ncbi:nucleotidyltransferase domain-containing protein [Dactylosporangium sp. NBC_01737]|uniref:nucleotidyltransferase domain-containing protein n=1 Tax=Dactylosporangium sp. NBC_01737 TaxID=2975959 RepID=UPI002E10056D|nr:nucleotidyltransferase domain-containing protein [Dactylosporangium sp. NBC_01737]
MKAVQRLADQISEVVQGDLLALILHGSLATGDFLPGRSDIDLLVVVGTDLASDRAGALERLVRGADLGDAAGIDLHVVTASAVAAPQRTPPLELHIGRYPSGVEVTDAVDADADLLVELAMARDGGRALHGPPPQEVIGEIPAQWVRDRGRHWLTTWQVLTEDDEHAAHMVLTACRIWRFAAEERHCGKVDAATWATARDPSLVAITAALHRYTTGERDRIEPSAIGQVLDTVLREAERQIRCDRDRIR